MGYRGAVTVGANTYVARLGSEGPGRLRLMAAIKFFNLFYPCQKFDLIAASMCDI